jgi:valyl-tRNA synthetase
MTSEHKMSVLDAMNGPFDHSAVEGRLYKEWESAGYFQPSPDADRKPFTIAIPPPNITGQLHNGHVLFVAYQDLMIRWQRMRGQAALWIPGTDHAAIATQNVIERNLSEEGTTRHELGREAFEERFWEWKASVGGTINDQLRRLGASVDWTREHFTLDDQLSRAVREAFVRLYERKMVYRGAYLVNWCPEDQSAISDLEVEHQDVEGTLWHIRYPLADGGHITVATTRPETMLGDTAIAVHPNDDRYTSVVGRHAVVPGIERRIPVIADSYVDPEFGSGAVKVTPGHDPNDWDMGQRHELDVINVMNGDGTLNEKAGRWAGKDRFTARNEYLSYLEEEGLIELVEAHEHSVGHCSRDGAVIEPLVSEQWFVNMKSMANAATAAVNEGRIRFHPPRFKDEFLRWMEGIQPWCISRQLWLGHRLPVWYCQTCPEIIVAREEPTICTACDGINLEQDEDVLDTWFSSGLWPFSTLGWPEETPDMHRFYPTDVLETGYDIIFFWVARMVMLGLELTGDVPFHDVYLHGLVRHLDGTKVQKSNYQPGDDPAETIDRYGVDAMRFAFVTGSTAGNDMRLNFERVERSGHFANKLWNGAKFVISAMEKAGSTTPAAPTAVDHWITSRLTQVHTDVVSHIDLFRFGEAGRTLQEYVWSEFFDWYIEAAKIRLYSENEGAAARVAETLQRVLDLTLRLLHPFMPFVTEEIWRHFRAAGGAPQSPRHLIATEIPTPSTEVDHTSISRIRDVIEIVQGIRNARHEADVDPAREVEARIVGGSAALQEESAMIERMARVNPLTFHPAGTAFNEPALTVRSSNGEVMLPISGLVDLATEQKRLARELAEAEAILGRAEKLLTNENFIARAPQAVILKEKKRADEARNRIAQIREREAALEGQGFP